MQSHKKWQLSFIDNVFALKTKRHHTFSKIIINNPHLLNDKNDHIPMSLFKFYAPTPDNILDIKNQRLWLSKPSSFNDPFDCYIGYDYKNYEKYFLLKHIQKVGFVDSLIEIANELKVELKLMSIDNQKFILEPHDTFLYRWNKGIHKK